MNKLTDAEILKVLECHIKRQCWNDCPNATEERLLLSRPCSQMIAEDSLDIINRQKSEIERLQKEVDRLSQCVLYHDGQIADAKAEAIKEVTAELYNSLRQYENYDTHHTYEILDRIESVEEFLLKNLVKEMVGDANA